MNTRPRASLATATVLSAGLVLSACGNSTSPASPGATDASSAESASASGFQGGLTVFAAASLKKTFTQLGTQFEAAHPGVRVNLNFGGSSDLVAQLNQGAPGDVFASADEKNMAKAVAAGIVTGAPVPFASNTLTIVTAPGNPKKITDLLSLAEQSSSGTNVVVCAAPVPCGAATLRVEKASGADIKPVSQEQSVTDVLGKVTSGQADAGLVYVTDVKGAGDKVQAVDFPESKDAVNLYPIAALEGAKDAATAKAFVDYIAGPEGKKVLSDAGFASP